jgi:FAD/FMN-containing dehydrogenase
MPFFSVVHPTDIVYPYFQGFSCLPTLNASTPCTNGGSPEYAVNVSNPDQIAAALKFARKKNIRLVIKNTGHDVNGKSTGAGSLSVWTHNLKKINFIAHYSDGYYTGPALKVGAGVSLEEYYRAAKNYGVTVVGGECSVSSPINGIKSES